MEAMKGFILGRFLVISKEVGSVSKAEILDESAGADFPRRVVGCVDQLPRAHVISALYF